MSSPSRVRPGARSSLTNCRRVCGNPSLTVGALIGYTALHFYVAHPLWRMRGDTICAIHMQLTNIHEILEPLPINFQSQGPAILPSRKASPKYVQANQRWWLEVQFSSDIDLALFEKTIAGSPIRVTDFQHRLFIEDTK